MDKQDAIADYGLRRDADNTVNGNGLNESGEHVAGEEGAAWTTLGNTGATDFSNFALPACKPCQEPLPDRAEGEWWSEMEEVFHQD